MHRLAGLSRSYAKDLGGGLITSLGTPARQQAKVDIPYNKEIDSLSDNYCDMFAPLSQPITNQLPNPFRHGYLKTGMDGQRTYR